MGIQSLLLLQAIHSATPFVRKKSEVIVKGRGNHVEKKSLYKV